MKTFLFRSMIGIFFGAFVSVLITFAFIYFGGYETIDSGTFFKNSLGSIFCGWFFSTSPLYFELPFLKLHHQTILHFITVTILFFILSVGIGWIPFNVTSILITAILFIVGYVIMWLCFYLYFKHEAKKLNEELR
ncbi:DUF3021 domain-containing protein [Virgibacillus oceani]|uniref:Permease n=1 Tax=Virgibacillus oceani TaxID=1479511 RepID=A0A917HIN8_9BACI|nr:DUF3021 domain-containing protein [Virgibacillus oceani]GGG80562.1 permease [Virgibacillus oceani]